MSLASEAIEDNDMLIVWGEGETEEEVQIGWV